MLRRVILHTAYGGGTYHFDADHPEMVIRACIAQAEGFEKALVEHPRAFVITVTDGICSYLSPEEYEMGLGKAQDIHIVPEVSGSGFELVAIYYGMTVATMTWTIGTIAAAIAINVAISFVVGAVIQALAPTPKMNKGEAAKENGSALFGNVENTIGPGGAVPIVYGTYTVVAQQVANTIDNVDVPYVSAQDGSTSNPGTESWQYFEGY